MMKDILQNKPSRKIRTKEQSGHIPEKCSLPGRGWNLFISVQKGDKNAFKKLMDKHYKVVYNVCFKYLRDKESALDATQEVFAKLLEKGKDFSVKRYPFDFWFYRVVINHCHNVNRRRSLEAKIFVTADDKENLPPHSSFHKSHNYDSQKQLDQLNSILPTLKKKERMAYIFHEMLGLPLKEVETILNTPSYTLRRRVQNAQKTIAGIFKRRSE